LNWAREDRRAKILTIKIKGKKGGMEKKVNLKERRHNEHNLQRQKLQQVLHTLRRAGR